MKSTNTMKTKKLTMMTFMKACVYKKETKFIKNELMSWKVGHLLLSQDEKYFPYLDATYNQLGLTMNVDQLDLELWHEWLQKDDFEKRFLEARG